MNRNTEAHFSQTPTAHVQRSVFDRGFSHKTTFNVGEVVPIFLQEILPGDTVNLSTSKVVRLQTMLTPVMDNIYLDTYYFFVPNRLTWKHWKEFMGENTSSAWTPSVTYSIPTISSPSGGFAVGSLADHFGLPVGVEWDATDGEAPIALPFRAYALIMDHFFRSENLSDPLLIPDGDSNQVGSNGSNYISDVANGGKPFLAAKFHDYFTSCLPSPQRGPSVAIPSTGSLPVVPGSSRSFPFGSYATTGVDVLKYDQASGTYIPSAERYFSNDGSASDTVHLSGTPTFDQREYIVPNNLVAASDGSSNLSFSVNDLRLAVTTQAYYEALARSGSRYDEQILQFFGVRSPDARLQNPEYLGGNRIQLNVHEVTNTAQSELDFLGDVGAKSVTGDNHSDFIKSFVEHGYVIGVCVVRYDHSYMQGINRMWLRKSSFDFYNPIFARLGEQPVKEVEIYADAENMVDSPVFGYQEAWADYRVSPSNHATGLMRPNVSGSFGHWTLTDNYSSAPVLSDAWIREDKTNVDRVLAVSSSLSDQIFADFYFDFKHTRPMPMYSIPGTFGMF